MNVSDADTTIQLISAAYDLAGTLVAGATIYFVVKTAGGEAHSPPVPAASSKKSF